MTARGKGSRTIGFFLTMVGVSAYLDHASTSLAVIVGMSGVLLWVRGLSALRERAA